LATLDIAVDFLKTRNNFEISSIDLATLDIGKFNVKDVTNLS